MDLNEIFESFQNPFHSKDRLCLPRVFIRLLMLLSFLVFLPKLSSASPSILVYKHHDSSCGNVGNVYLEFQVNRCLSLSPTSFIAFSWNSSKNDSIRIDKFIDADCIALDKSISIKFSSCHINSSIISLFIPSTFQQDHSSVFVEFVDDFQVDETFFNEMVFSGWKCEGEPEYRIIYPPDISCFSSSQTISSKYVCSAGIPYFQQYSDPNCTHLHRETQMEGCRRTEGSFSRNVMCGGTAHTIRNVLRSVSNKNIDFIEPVILRCYPGKDDCSVLGFDFGVIAHDVYFCDGKKNCLPYPSSSSSERSNSNTSRACKFDYDRRLWMKVRDCDEIRRLIRVEYYNDWKCASSSALFTQSYFIGDDFSNVGGEFDTKLICHTGDDYIYSLERNVETADFTFNYEDIVFRLFHDSQCYVYSDSYMIVRVMWQSEKQTRLNENDQEYSFTVSCSDDMQKIVLSEELSTLDDGKIVNNNSSLRLDGCNRLSEDDQIFNVFYVLERDISLPTYYVASNRDFCRSLWTKRRFWITILYSYGSGIGGAILVVLLILIIIGIIGFIIFYNKKGYLIRSLLKLEKEELTIIMDEVHAEQLDEVSNIKLKPELYKIDNKELEFLKVLGEGGYAQVMLVRYRREKFAYKSFDLRMSEDKDKHVMNFEEEVTILMNLLSPHIAKFFGAVCQLPKLGILMEYCSNGDLMTFVKNFKKLSSRKLPFHERTRFSHEIARGMEYLHQMNVLHRDLKPKNVLISKNFEVKIIDFGLSRFMKEGEKTKTKLLGTSLFMAPEVIDGKYSEKCDVFSFAITIYVLFTGLNNPYREKTKNRMGILTGIEMRVALDPKFRPDMNKLCFTNKDDLKDLIIRCWDDSPEARPSFKEISQFFEKKFPSNDESAEQRSIRLDALGVQKLQKVREDAEWKSMITVRCTCGDCEKFIVFDTAGEYLKIGDLKIEYRMIDDLQLREIGEGRKLRKEVIFLMKDGNSVVVLMTKRFHEVFQERFDLFFAPERKKKDIHVEASEEIEIKETPSPAEPEITNEKDVELEEKEKSGEMEVKQEEDEDEESEGETEADEIDDHHKKTDDDEGESTGTNEDEDDTDDDESEIIDSDSSTYHTEEEDEAENKE